MKSTQSHIKSQNRRSLFKRRSLYIALLFTTLILAIWQIAQFTEKRSLKLLEQTGALRVNLYAGSLRDTLLKYRHLPYVLARDSRIIALLRDDIPSLRVNPHLEDFAHTSEALIYVLDRGGTTVATSNWRSANTLLGHNFSFRPYFTDAKSGNSGAYYAVGLRTRQPGFFLSYPVKDVGEFLGAIVVKVNLEPMQEAWKKSGEAVIVSDAFGVIFLTSKKEWKYTSLRELPQTTARRLQAVQYLNRPLTALKMNRESRMSYTVLHLDNKSYLEQALQLPEYGWRLHYLTDLQAVENDVKLAITIATIIASLLLLALLYVMERRAKQRSLQEAKEANAVKEINERLLQEIAKHKETETNLRKTQKELIQAGKLAALGRMSAAIAHELNQPVSAIRTFAASCRVFVERDQTENVVENLGFISKLTERMGKITAQLKTFARKSKGKEEQIDLVEVIKRLLMLINPEIKQRGAQLELQLPDKGVAMVIGDGLQVEQVLSNLINNSLDAVKNTTPKTLKLGIHVLQARVRIVISDSGTGISKDALDNLFEPFFTTKDIGEGLGLGLSISYGIIQEMGGTISAENLPRGGAQFIVELPLATQELDNAE